MTAFSTTVFIASLVFLLFFVTLHLNQLVRGTVATWSVWHYVRTRHVRNIALSRHLPAPPRVSVIVPARNEALTIVQCLQALQAVDYEPREIVVVNDGSTDESLRLLKEAFELVAAPVAYAQPLPSAPVRAVYRSLREPELLVIDKDPGGCKSDAINAGINAATGELVLTVDADTVFEPDAVRRVVLPFLEHPETIGVAGNVAVVNGCRVENGRIIEVALPRSWLARFQVLEYMRSFLVLRSALAHVNALTIVAGAFGLFRRDAVLAVGGYDRTATAEDMDLTLRLQGLWRERGKAFRIALDPSPVCSTQVPGDLRSLRSQRCRWRRGLLQTLWRHRNMIGNPRHGFHGMVALPSMVVFEVLGPLIEMLGYLLTTTAAILGILNWKVYLILLASSMLLGLSVTLCAILLSDLATRRYARGGDVARLLVTAILESCGYRQLNSWWSIVGTVQFLTGKGGWGTIKRSVFEGKET